MPSQPWSVEFGLWKNSLSISISHREYHKNSIECLTEINVCKTNTMPVLHCYVQSLRASSKLVHVDLPLTKTCWVQDNSALPSKCMVVNCSWDDTLHELRCNTCRFVFSVISSLVLFGCQCNQLPGKTHLQNDLLCVKWDVKPYRPTHSLSERLSVTYTHTSFIGIWQRYRSCIVSFELRTSLRTLSISLHGS